MNFTRRKVKEEFSFLGLPLAVLFYASCSKKESTVVTPQLSVSPSQASLPADGGTTDLTVTGNFTKCCP